MGVSSRPSPTQRRRGGGEGGSEGAGGGWLGAPRSPRAEQQPPRRPPRCLVARLRAGGGGDRSAQEPSLGQDNYTTQLLKLSTNVLWEQEQHSITIMPLNPWLSSVRILIQDLWGRSRPEKVPLPNNCIISELED